MVNLFNIPISDEGKPVFEFNFAKQIQSIKDAPGFVAYRFLKAKKGDTYILLTLWTDESYFKHWKGRMAIKTSSTVFQLKTPYPVINFLMVERMKRNTPFHQKKIAMPHNKVGHCYLAKVIFCLLA